MYRNISIHTTIQKSGFYLFFKYASCAYQDCIYLIKYKNIVKYYYFFLNI